MRIKQGDKIALSACSNSFPEGERERLAMLLRILEAMGLKASVSRFLFSGSPSAYGGADREKAGELMEFFADPEIKAVFDITGGDLAGGLLDYLDFERMGKQWKPFFGYSDLTAVLNAAYSQNGKPVYLWQLRNLTGEQAQQQRRYFESALFSGGKELFQFEYRFLRGEEMEGRVFGGNIRCLLKLAGTPFFPSPDGAVLFLECLSGGPARISSYLCQLRQMGVFSRIKGLLLGTFTELLQKGELPGFWEHILALTDNPGLPVAVTDQIGHGGDSRCLILGQPIRLKK